MVFALIIVLIALTFGFLFAKLDTINKNFKILKENFEELQKQFNDIKNKQ